MIHEKFIEKRHGIYTHSKVCLCTLICSLQLTLPRSSCPRTSTSIKVGPRSHSQFASVRRLEEAECNFLIDAIGLYTGNGNRSHRTTRKHSYAIQCQYFALFVHQYARYAHVRTMRVRVANCREQITSY